MIEYVHRRLVAWGEWSVSSADGGFAGTGQFSYREQVPGAARSGEALSKILANSPALEMEMGVAWLCKTEEPIGEIVLDFYRDNPGRKAESMAADHCCSVRMFWYRIDKAHAMLLDWMHGRDVGEHEAALLEAWEHYQGRCVRVVKVPAPAPVPEPESSDR